MLLVKLPLTLLLCALLARAATIPQDGTTLYQSDDFGSERIARPLNTTDDLTDDLGELEVKYTLSRTILKPETLFMGIIHALRELARKDWTEVLDGPLDYPPQPGFLFTTVTYKNAIGTASTQNSHLVTVLNRLAVQLKNDQTYRGFAFTILLDSKELGSGRVFFNPDFTTPSLPPNHNIAVDADPAALYNLTVNDTDTLSPLPNSEPVPYTYTPFPIPPSPTPPTKAMRELDTMIAYIFTLATLARRPYSVHVFRTLFTQPGIDTVIYLETGGVMFPQLLLVSGAVGAVWVAAGAMYLESEWERGLGVTVKRDGREAGEIKVRGANLVAGGGGQVETS